MICPACGFDNIQGSFVCSECGMELGGLDIPEALPMQGLKRLIMQDSIREVSPASPLIVTMDTTIWEAIQAMRGARHGSVLVVDPSDSTKLVGIFTERDVLIRVWNSGVDIYNTPVSEVMTSDPVTLEEDDKLVFAIHLMSVRSFRHIPIVRDGLPVGFVSVRGILRYISEEILGEG